VESGNGIKRGEMSFCSGYVSFALLSRYVLLPFYSFMFGVGKQCQKLAKKLRQAVSTNTYFMLAAKGGTTERKLRRCRESGQKKKENTFCHFPATGIITNDATAPFSTQQRTSLIIKKEKKNI